MSELPQPPYDANRVYEIPLKHIFADDDFNSRGIINPTTLLELAKSIEDRGLDQPITLQPWSIKSRPDIKFRIVAGYRRYKAHQFIKAATIRSLVKEGLSDIDARVLNLTENLHRADLNPKQEAHAIEHLKLLGLTQPQVAARIGKSRGWVQERFYLVEMPEEIQDDVAAGLVTLKQIRHAWALESVEEQFEYVKKIKDAKLLGKKREVDPNSVRKINEKKVRGRDEIFELQDTIRDALGNSLTTKALAWAGGEISDTEIHRAIFNAAQSAGKWYSMPEGLEGTRAKVG